jgi:bifunctional DNase/RNase
MKWRPWREGFTDMLVQMKVEGLLFDPRSSMYILLLKEIDGNDTLPIWIGKQEADSIALALGRVVTPRPLTHDLIKNIFNGLKVKVSRIVVTEIYDNTYYALMYLTDGKKEVPIDSRPSDAVAVALRVDAPIFVENGILEKKSGDELEEWLKNLKPEDFGNVM